jgi:hypothetical protein
MNIKVLAEHVSPKCSINLILPASLGPGICSASNRNEYQKQKKKKHVSGEQSTAGAQD